MDSEKKVNEQLASVSVADLIAELFRRKLTDADINTLRSLRSEKPIQASQTSIENKNLGLSSIDRFVQMIAKKNFHGKLPSGAAIDGVRISEPNIYTNHGPDKEMGFTPFEKLVHSLHEKIEHKQEKIPGLMQSEIVSFSPSVANPKNMNIMLSFFQDRKQVDGRGWCTSAHAQIELPANMVSELMKNVCSNPDMLEAFYQRAFKDLDSKGEGLPGARRVKVSGFYLLTPADQNDINVAASSYDDGKSINDLFQNKLRYKFQNGPYGNGEVFQPR